jgi:hypothetical protein
MRNANRSVGRIDGFRKEADSEGLKLSAAPSSSEKLFAALLPSSKTVRVRVSFPFPSQKLSASVFPSRFLPENCPRPCFLPRIPRISAPR